MCFINDFGFGYLDIGEMVWPFPGNVLKMLRNFTTHSFTTCTFTSRLLSDMYGVVLKVAEGAFIFE